VTNTSTVAISGSGTVDELRLFPAAAQMTSHCYKPLIGMLTQNDPNNQILYYEYDNAGRLKLIRDMDNNIIKTITYQYQTTTP
jgi:YD repeat-containing protein